MRHAACFSPVGLAVCGQSTFFFPLFLHVPSSRADGFITPQNLDEVFDHTAFFSTAELWLNIAHLTRSHFTGCVFTPALISLFKTPRHLITFFFFLPRHLISVTFLLCLHKQEIDYIKPKRTRAASADEYGGDINVNTSKYGRLK